MKVMTLSGGLELQFDVASDFPGSQAEIAVFTIEAINKALQEVLPNLGAQIFMDRVTVKIETQEINERD